MKEGWTYKKLVDLCKIRTGKHDANHAKENGAYRFYTCAAQYVYCDTYSFDGDCLILPGNGANVGDVYMYSGKFDAYQRTYVLSNIKREEINFKYLYYFFLGNWSKKGTANQYGTATNYIIMSNFTGFTIGYPSLSEQRHIVEELDLLSTIIEKKKKQINELDNLAQSFFYEMFGDPITNEVASLSDVVEIKSSLVSPNELPYSEMLHISPANIISGTGEIVNCMRAKDENLISGKYTFSQGDVLYSKIRPNLNKVAIPNFSGICSADMYPLSVKEKANNVYLWRLLLSKDFLEYAIKHSGRARMPKLNRETLFAYKFALPPLSLQQYFASKIEAIEHQKELINQSIKEIETLFNSRMDYYFN